MLHHQASLQLDEPLLSGVVRQALGHDSVALGNWNAQRIDYANVAADSRQLWRVAGTSGDALAARWSLVLKVFTPPTGGTAGEVAAPFYWKREALAYQSSLLAALPGGLSAPRCFGVTERPDSQLWLWLEDLQTADDQPWPLPRFGLAARHFGTMGGAYVRQQALAPFAWLSRGVLRAWVDDAGPLVDRARRPGTWHHPLLRRHFPAALVDAVLALWSEREGLIARLERLPQTLCHHDVWRKNLFSRAGANEEQETVAIDWELIGRGAAGEDIGNLLGVSLLNLDVAAGDAAELAATMLHHYIGGLRTAGWDGDPRAIAYAFDTAAALRCVFSACCWPAAILGDEQGRHVAETEQRWGRSIEDIVAAWAAVTRFLLDRTDAARALASSL